MSLAKGTKSALIWAEETTYDTVPSAVAYQGSVFSTESLVEQIDTIISQDIRSDRATSAVRGGNFANGGSLSQDFGIRRSLVWLRHMCCIPKAPQAALGQITLTSPLAITRGNYYIANSGVYLALTSATYTKVAGTVAGDFTNTTLYGSFSIGGVTWSYVGTSAAVTTIYPYVFLGGTDFDTAGLAFEKSILGGSSARYVAFSGGRVDGVDLTVPQKGIVQANWGLLFLSSQDSATSIAAPSSTTNPTDDPVTGYDAFISINSGTTVRPIQQATIGIHNQIDSNAFIIGSRARAELPAGIRGLTAKVTAYFQDAAEYTLFKNETNIPIKFSFIHNGEYLEIKFAEAKITGAGTPQINGAGLLTASFDVTGFKQNQSNDLTITAYCLTDQAILHT